MRTHRLILGPVLLLSTAVVYTVDASEICYKAKTCIHNANEKCGVDSKGEYRRFFDNCDILEYNCLFSADYKKTEMEKCSDLPPIPDDTENVKSRLALNLGQNKSVVSNDRIEKKDALQTPSVQHKRRKRSAKSLYGVINEWWCWEGSRCSSRPQKDPRPVCGWEKETNHRIKFANKCLMAKDNCHKRRDFHVIKVRKCDETITRRRFPTNLDEDGDLLD